MSMASRRRGPARKVFAASMRERRTALGLSQERLAELTGLHRTYVGSVERAERNISIDNMARIAHALRVTLSSLLEGSD